MKNILTVNYSFKKKLIGYVATCDLMDMSIHKGLFAWGFTKKTAKNNLNKKWNNIVEEDSKKMKNRLVNHSNITTQLLEFKEI